MKTRMNNLSNLLFFALFLAVLIGAVGQIRGLSAEPAALSETTDSQPLEPNNEVIQETVSSLAPHLQESVQVDTTLVGQVDLVWGATGTYTDSWTANQLSELTEDATIDLSLLLEKGAGTGVTTYVELENTLVFTRQHVITATTHSGDVTAVSVGPKSSGSLSGNQLNLVSERISYTTGSGQLVERQFQMIGEPSQTAGLLRGEYRETVWGVSLEPLTIIGTFELQEIEGSILVVDENRPHTGSDQVTVNLGESVLIDVLANDTAVNGQLDPTSVEITDAPDKGTVTVNSSTGAITYQAADSGIGIDTFSYTVRDTKGVNSAATRVTITVNGPDGPQSGSTIYLPIINR